LTDGDRPLAARGIAARRIRLARARMDSVRDLARLFLHLQRLVGEATLAMTAAELRNTLPEEAQITFLDHLPAGWFVVSVGPWFEACDGIWIALVTDIDPDERPGGVANTFVRIPGEHFDYESACAAFEDMAATRH
jgi:hypothetical protein